MWSGAATLERSNWQLLNLLNIKLLYDPAILLLGVYPREIKMYAHTKTGTQMFKIKLFVIATKYKQLKCLPSDEQISKMWFIHQMEY